jgi:hypothetical protein
VNGGGTVLGGGDNKNLFNSTLENDSGSDTSVDHGKPEDSRGKSVISSIYVIPESLIQQNQNVRQ